MKTHYNCLLSHFALLRFKLKGQSDPRQELFNWKQSDRIEIRRSAVQVIENCYGIVTTATWDERERTGEA